MSSTYSESTEAAKCVDGVIDESSMCHSHEETNPWFVLDLQKEHYVSAVNVHIHSSKFR